MEYQSLKEKITKEPIKWTENDINIFLRHVNLEELIPVFSKFQSQINTKQMDHVYSTQKTISSKTNQAFPPPSPGKNLSTVRFFLTGIQFIIIHYNDKQPKISILSEIQEQTFIINTRKTISSLQCIKTTPKKPSSPCEKNLVLTPIENSCTFHYITPPCTIGRNGSNQLVISQDSVSRFHAEIVYKDNDFWVRDTGSLMGTYIKVDPRTYLQNGMVIEIGSQEFQVQIPKEKQELTIKHFKQNQLNEKIFSIPNQQFCITIGRRFTNVMSFQQDNHMSNLHAKIQRIQNKLIIQDQNSTNGTWIRLSKENERSKLYKISSGYVLKFGSTLSYMCLSSFVKAYNEKGKISQIDLCTLCCNAQKNALYLPCKHNTACIRCSRGLFQCPICRIKIGDVIRIYKC